MDNYDEINEYIFNKNNELGLGIPVDDINNVAIEYYELLNNNGIYEFEENDEILRTAVANRNKAIADNGYEESFYEEVKIENEIYTDERKMFEQLISSKNSEIIQEDDYGHGL